MSEIKRIRVNNRFSEAVVHGGIVYISGLVDLSAARTARQQTKNVLAIIDELLAEAGTDKSRLLRAFVYLANIGDLQDMNKEWEAWVVPESTPARTVAQCELSSPAFLVQVSAEAAL